ncbi:MAG TPA: MFS transporter, partial [Chloroflexota bacterium]
MIARAVGGRVHYAWAVVAVTFIVMVSSAGIRSIPGVLILPLEGEFGWSRAAISAAVSINLVLYGLCGPFAAAVMERVGMRTMMICALSLLGSAVLIATRITDVWQLQLLWGVVVGIGAGSMAGWVAASVANRWFAERRGVVVGILTAANATGQLIFLPTVAFLVTMQGWRTAVLAPALVILAVIPLVWLVIRSFPRDVGLRPFGAADNGPLIELAPRLVGNPFKRAINVLRSGVRDRDFLLLAGSFFVCGASTNGLIGTHL